MKLLRQVMMGIIFILMVSSASLATQVEAAYPLSTDPMRVKQTYLDLIHINEAWAASPDSSSSLVVAVVDTGVDLTHPDLVDHLVDGINLINPGSTPQDDNGHGTNIAGIIAASANNDKGITGIVPGARIMPIKALESDGTGGEAKLGEGIRYAVDHGAKIVVLSLGLNRYSDYLSGIVQDAEEKGVLLVAAVGNEGTSVKYPAAYTSVLAVGGVTANKRADHRSNYGPELDIVAPWDVFTTALGGGYENKDGSSMAAPQAAGVAALIWGKYPSFTPAQIRSLLLQTTENLDTPGWDVKTGYGLLRADYAMTKPFSDDRFEPNNLRDEAKKIPVQSKIEATLSSAQDQDWFALESPYDGTVEFKAHTFDGTELSLRMDQGSPDTSSYFSVGGGNASVSFQVRKGINYLQLQTTDRSRVLPVNYSLETDFHIYRDPFENNDKQYQAYVLPDRSQSVKGTFHQPNDQDWFLLSLRHSGTLRLKVAVDSARIDSVILIQKKGEKSTTIDQVGDGAVEISPLLDVLEGDYYIRISNVKEYTEPVAGEYTLTIEYTPKLIDPNEPNDKSYQATFLGMFSEYEGVFHKAGDQDWFEFRLSEESLVQLDMNHIPANRLVTFTLFDSNMKQQALLKNKSGQTAIHWDQPLSQGTYYIKLQADQPFLNQLYTLQAEAYPFESGYIDVKGHWAAGAITEMTRRDLVGGYGNYRFEPDRAISRAEAATILTKSLNLTKQKELKYYDLNTNHWAYSYISKAEQAGIVDGYPNQLFAPDRSLTRMEMTSMLARSMDLKGNLGVGSPFYDVSNDYWGLGILKQMASNGWVSGYPDGSFRPEQKATRAEFISVLMKVLNR
jgi:hypothetical protein